MGAEEDEFAVPYGGDHQPRDPGPGAGTSEERAGFARGFRAALAIQAVIYAAGLAAWSVENELAWPVVVYWFTALAAGLVVGLALLLNPSTRRRGNGLMTGTLVAGVLELVTTAVVWGLWLTAHPGWELS